MPNKMEIFLKPPEIPLPPLALKLCQYNNLLITPPFHNNIVQWFTLNFYWAVKCLQSWFAAFSTKLSLLDWLKLLEGEERKLNYINFKCGYEILNNVWKIEYIYNISLPQVTLSWFCKIPPISTYWIHSRKTTNQNQGIWLYGLRDFQQKFTWRNCWSVHKSIAIHNFWTMYSGISK